MSTSTPRDAQLSSQMRDDFLVESQEALDRLGRLLGQLEQAGAPDVINQIFREMHTLKGTAGLLGLEDIERLAHKMEDVFGAVRAEKLAVTPELVDLTLAGVQVLTAMRHELALGGSSEAAGAAPLTSRLEAVLAGAEAGLPPKEAAPTSGAATPSLAPSLRQAMAPAAESIVVENTLRVDVETIDTLMALIGKLITARDRLVTIAGRLDDRPLQENAASIARLTNLLQSAVSVLRLVPVERLFSRFTPVVESLARDRGKQVRLVVEGGSTLLDRGVFEDLYDPLFHMLRNAIDHGLEPAAERQRVGKAAEGTLRLTAERQGDTVIMRLADDGRGIDSARVRRAAVERGLLSEAEAAAQSDDEALNLIFQPGVSTAGVVTEFSGRGVGMDVAWQHVRRLGGEISIETALGRGTTFVIRMPFSSDRLAEQA